MMNEQDQVTWTNWPASKKNHLPTDLENELKVQNAFTRRGALELSGLATFEMHHSA